MRPSSNGTKDRGVTAIHEAGHAIFDWLDSSNFEISIYSSNSQKAGEVTHNKFVGNRTSAALSIVGAWGGVLAEGRHLNEEDPYDLIYTSGVGDYEWIDRISTQWFGEDADYIAGELSDYVKTIIDRFWSQIERIASLLQEKDIISSDEIAAEIGTFSFAQYQEEIVKPLEVIIGAQRNLEISN
ncbi:hypothetical protein [Leptolyngbya sp. FACHB-17]|uniref:hypothetical protein n=1 Tax=unclassified Leptolyngbya TaxID=2650499 RepID=UPI00168117B9|nr:hypothetical protein [Leptolyngbya sp. FACHB-17]MBD2078800.1 hypothetical protein [Leptolyngbya sp. FACHB-17]